MSSSSSSSVSGAVFVSEVNFTTSCFSVFVHVIGGND